MRHRYGASRCNAMRLGTRTPTLSQVSRRMARRLHWATVGLNIAHKQTGGARCADCQLAARRPADGTKIKRASGAVALYVGPWGL